MARANGVVIKKEIVSKVAGDTGYTQKMVGIVVEALLAEIAHEMSNGYKVQFAGFGAFEPKVMAARISRNPRTNEPIPIPERVMPSFKPGSRLKEAVMRAKC